MLAKFIGVALVWHTTTRLNFLYGILVVSMAGIGCYGGLYNITIEASLLHVCLVYFVILLGVLIWR